MFCLARLCERSGELAERFGVARLAQGFAALWGEESGGDSLFSGDAPLGYRIRVLRSMACVFRDVIARWPTAPDHVIFFMWWDIIASAAKGTRSARPDKACVPPETDACLETLAVVLALPDAFCQLCPLHGLNHLPHPGVPDLVQRWIDGHRHTKFPDLSDYTPDMIPYAEACRDGEAL